MCLTPPAAASTCFHFVTPLALNSFQPGQMLFVTSYSWAWMTSEKGATGVNILVRYGSKNFRVGARIPWEVTVKISGL